MRLFKLLFIVFVSATHIASADGFDYLGQIKKYVKCEAIQNVAANIESESEEEFHQHELNHASLDSRIVAMELAKAGGYSSEQVSELYYVYLSEYRKILQESEDQSDVDNFLRSLRPLIDECERLIAMQSDLIKSRKNQTEYYDKNQQQ